MANAGRGPRGDEDPRKDSKEIPPPTCPLFLWVCEAEISKTQAVPNLPSWGWEGRESQQEPAGASLRALEKT